MRFTIKELLEKGEMIVPMGRQLKPNPSGKERETLQLFEEEWIEISDYALPIEVFLMGGNPKTLALHPNKGGNILQAGAKKWLKKEACKLLICAEPLEG